MPNMMDILRDAAVARDEARAERYQALRESMKLGPLESLGDLIEIEVDETTNRVVRFAVEIICYPPGSLRKVGAVETSYWAAGVSGDALPERFISVDHALLAAVEWHHNGARQSPRGWLFAARALGVPEEGDR